MKFTHAAYKIQHNSAQVGAGRRLTSTDIWKICGVVRYEKVMVFEEASSGLKRDRNRLMMEVLAVPAPPTNRDAWHQQNSAKQTAETTAPSKYCAV